MTTKKYKTEINLEKNNCGALIQGRLNEALLKEKKKLESEGFDIPLMSLSIKENNKQKFEPEKKFTKLYSGKLEEIENDLGLSSAEKHIIFTLSRYIGYEDNLLYHPNGNPIKKKDLEKILGYGHNAIDKHIKSLVEKGVLAKVIVKRSANYYMNPYIAYRGSGIDSTLLNMFNKAN